MLADEYTPLNQEINANPVDDLVFDEMLPSSAFGSGGIPGFAGFNFTSLGFSGNGQPFGSITDDTEATPKGANLRTVSSSERLGRADAMGDVVSWGSEVEMPQPDETVPPPRAPPTINIQAPTESQATKSQRAVTPSGRSQGGSRNPRPDPTKTLKEPVMQDGTAAPFNPKERDLPPSPSEINRSIAPSPASKYIFRRTSAQQSLTSVENPLTQLHDQESQTVYKTADQESTGRPSSIHRDKLHVIDPINPRMGDPAPWDLVTQRLYSWALVWEEHTFIRALENISLGNQVSSLEVKR